jgi:hypothetical protein
MSKNQSDTETTKTDDESGQIIAVGEAAVEVVKVAAVGVVHAFINAVFLKK